jgi:hypothetical protein
MTDKDILIQQLFEQIRLLQAENTMLREKIARLEKNSSNSSKPPSSDIINPQPANKKNKKLKIGGQMGHPKYNRTLFEADEIDRTVIHKISVEEVRRPPDHIEAVNIKKRFVDGVDRCYFLFLEREDVSPTNNLSEQAIRFVFYR